MPIQTTPPTERNDPPLRILIVEDSLTDAELIARVLERYGLTFAWQRVDNAETLAAALAEQTWDLVLSDYSMPRFDGLAALEVVKAREPDLPFILISGSIGEEIAVAAVKAGAVDYLLKDRLTRLGPAVTRALEEQKLQLAKKKAHAELLRAAEEWQRTFDSMDDMITIHDNEFRIVRANRAAAEILGTELEEIVGKHCYSVFHGTDCPIEGCPFQLSKKSGKMEVTEIWEPFLGKWLSITCNPLRDRNSHLTGVVHIIRDITERKVNEARIQRLLERQQVINKISLLLGESLDVITICETAYREVQKLVDCPNFGLFRYDEERREIAALYLIGDGRPLDISMLPRIPLEPGTGPQSRAILSQEPVIVADLLEDLPRIKTHLKLPTAKPIQPRSVLTAPMIIGKKIIGTMQLQSYKVDVYTPEDAQLLSGIASQVAMALQNAELYQNVQRELEKRIRADKALRKGMKQQQSLIAAAHQLVGSLDISQVLQRISHLAKDILDAYGCTVFLLEEDGRTLTPVAAVEPDDAEQRIMAMSLQVDGSLTGRAVRARRSFIFNDLSKEPDAFHIEGTPTYEQERILVAPLLFKDVVLGAMNLMRIGSIFDENDLALAETFAVYAATALQNARTYSELRWEIEQRGQAEEALRTSLREKEVLLQELYHRTKNNMQVISAMLALEESQIHEQRTKEVFRDIQSRIQAMGLVHQMLYQARDLSRIDMTHYVRELADLLMRSYNIATERIRLDLDIQCTAVLFDIAIPCGLILTELISNALKHAFPNQRSGEIRIRLHKSEDGLVILDVSDNGVGIPPELDLRTCETLGVQTVFAIAEHQLQGEVMYEANPGLRWRIRFKDNLYAARI